MPKQPTASDLTSVWYFYLPLALSGLMMAAGQPIAHAGLARLESPELVIAAYGIAFYMAILLESPIIMLLGAGNALVANEVAYRVVRNCMIVMASCLTLVTAIVAFWTPMYNLTFITFMQYPREVAQAAQPALMVLVLWPALIAIRRFYQGILIRYGHTRFVGIGTAVRLATMVVVLVVGIGHFPEHGIIVGGLALAASVFMDTAVALAAARRLLVTGILKSQSEPTPEGARDTGAFSRFYFPLAVTSMLRFVSWPLLLSGIARSYMPMLPLAVFPLALGTMQLISSHLQMLQQVVVALVRDQVSFRVVRRFALLVAGGSSVVMGLIALTPLGEVYHGGLLGLTGTVLGMTNMTVLFMVFVPLLSGLQAHNQGLLIRTGRTVPVNVAAVLNTLVVVSVINIVAVYTTWPGHLIAAAVLSLGLLLEVGVLRYCAAPLMREVR